jgi:hypothetical protein
MPRFRRKPRLVEAVQWTGGDPAWSAICALHADSERVAFREADGTVSIETTGGRVTAQLGDWIIKWAAEDFALCRPEGFAANYEPA